MVDKTGKKILHIVNVPWYSGLAGYAIDMAKYMEGIGESIIFAVVGNSPLYDRLKDSYEVLPLPGRDVFNSVRGVLKIWNIRNEIKLVFAHSGSSCFMGCVLALVKDIKVIRVRTEKEKVKKNIFNMIIHRLVSAVVVPTKLIMDDYLEFGIQKNRLILLPPVVDTEIFKLTPLPENMNIAIIGRLTRVKGHKVLVESLPSLKKEVKDIKILIAGSDKGNQMSKLKSYAKDLNVDKQIKYMGFLTDQEIANVMKNSRLGIIPSLWSEAVSRVALEFMASGRPVIASSVGILSEIIKQGINGFIIEPGNSRQLSSSILKILKNTELNIEMGENARELVENYFSAEVYKKNLKSLMERLNV